ncbi:MAG: hypothetical protein O7B26_09210 [Planctomycetota bacterium]|nr:hypothetical protein [Planctomycetota bacterium]
MSHLRRRPYSRWIIAAAISLCVAPFVIAQAESGSDQDQSETRPATDRPPVMPAPVASTDTPADSTERLEDGAASSETEPTQAQTEPPDINEPQHIYGLWALAPAMVAIILAIAIRQVIIALVFGILTAAGMMVFVPGEIAVGQSLYNPITIITYAVDNYLFRAIAPLNDAGDGVKYTRLYILIFTLMIGGMVGVIQANGGTRAVVDRLTRRVTRREQGQIRGFFAGIAVFFDDYANAMIVGPSMRPIFDRLRLSREKLAYIVDSTAAPVASIFIGTWLAAEIGYIDQGLDSLGEVKPAFLSAMNGTTAFWGSLPYRTYAILALVMVFVIAITGRDFGSMRRAENDAFANPTRRETLNSEETTEPTRSIWLGLLPVLVLVFGTMTLLATTGWFAVQKIPEEAAKIDWSSVVPIRDSLGVVLGQADSNAALLYASLAALAVAILITKTAGALSLAKTMDAVSSGVSRMAAACIVLVLAWGLSDAGDNLQLGKVASSFLSDKIERGVFSLSWLPLSIFVSACIVSFATGTSWGTMGILCPAVVTISASVLGDLPQDQALPIFYASVGAVLTGAVFGDHCSPISDTTVLSSIASECELGRHVWTQMPYALTVAAVGILATDGLDFALQKWAGTFYDSTWTAHGLNQYYSLIIGVILLVLIVLAIGRRPARQTPEPVVQHVV